MNDSDTKHDAKDVSAAPEVIRLSSEEASRLAAKMQGGSFASTTVRHSETATAPPARQAAKVSRAPRAHGSTSGDSVGKKTAPDTDPLMHGSSYYESEVERGIADLEAALDEAFHAPGMYGNPSMGTSTDNDAHTPAGGKPFSDGRAPQRYNTMGKPRFFDSLPELWGLDAALAIISIVGLCLVLVNLQPIMLGIARAVYVLFSMTLQFVLLVAVVLVAVYLLRRRRW